MITFNAKTAQCETMLQTLTAKLNAFLIEKNVITTPLTVATETRDNTIANTTRYIETTLRAHANDDLNEIELMIEIDCYNNVDVSALHDVAYNETLTIVSFDNATETFYLTDNANPMLSAMRYTNEMR